MATVTHPTPIAPSEHEKLLDAERDKIVAKGRNELRRQEESSLGEIVTREYWFEEPEIKRPCGGCRLELPYDGGIDLVAGESREGRITQLRAKESRE